MVVNNGLGVLTFEKPSWLHKLQQYRTTHVQRIARKLIGTCLEFHFYGVYVRDGKIVKSNIWNLKYSILSRFVYLDLHLSIQ